MNYEIKVLSLERRQDRREYITKLLDGKYPFTFFNAIDGRELIMTEEIEEMFKNSDFHLWNVHRNSVISVALSNMKIWEESVKYNKNICIFEDDIAFNIDEIVDLEKLFKKDFDIYFLNDIMDWFPNCHSYLVKPEGAQKLLDYFKDRGLYRSLAWELSNLAREPLHFKVMWLDKNYFTKTDDEVIGKSDLLVDGDRYKEI